MQPMYLHVWDIDALLGILVAEDCPLGLMVWDMMCLNMPSEDILLFCFVFVC